MKLKLKGDIMNHETYSKIANEICDKLVSLCNNNATGGKSLDELYSELLDKKYIEHRLTILTYIPDRLAYLGYEIVNVEHFAIRKY